MSLPRWMKTCQKCGASLHAFGSGVACKQCGMDSAFGAIAYRIEYAPPIYIRRVLTGLAMYSCSGVILSLLELMPPPPTDQTLPASALAWRIAIRVVPLLVFLLSVVLVIIPPRNRRLCRFPGFLLYCMPVSLVVISIWQVLAWLSAFETIGLLTSPRLPTSVTTPLAIGNIVCHGQIPSAMLCICGWLLYGGCRRTLAITVAVLAFVFPSGFLIASLFFAATPAPALMYLPTPLLVAACIVIIWRTYNRRIRAMTGQ